MSASVVVPIRMTVEEFMAWDSGDGRPWQLVDGIPEAMAPTDRTYGALQGELARLLGNHLVECSSRCSVIANPGIAPRVQAGHNVRIPDLAVTCTPYTSEEPLLADPVLVVEILSPSNQSETWSNVLAYTSIPGVQEIAVVRSASVGAEVLRRRADGAWPERPEAVTGGDLVLESIGFRAPLAALYRTTRLAPRA